MARRGPSSAFESETFGQDASFRLEQPVGSMSISPSGRDVALASKEGLHIVDLDSPYSLPRYLPHRTPWEVADVQWSPFAARDYWVVSTSNQKALVWNLEARSWQDSIEFVLHGHTRAITDINFSAHNPDVLATCAVDSFVHCWDLRAPSRPVNSFSDWFAGATQVKWSRQDEHVVASSHDKFLHIWDDRNGADPLRTIEAHDTKIYGVDWNRFHHNKIVTCSLDRTIRFWDIKNEGESVLERVIETPFPVWRARHTPFGWGLLAMPQRGGNSELHLYDRRALNGVLESGPVRPVATFAGHDGSQVKEFLWRSRGSVVDDVDQRDFQLVSWGTDRELRLHALEPDIYADIGYEKGISKVQRLNVTRKGAVYKTFRDVPGDAESPLDETPRSEMFPRQHSHLMPFRPRASTNIGMNKVPVLQFRGWVQGGRHAPRAGMHGRGVNRQTEDPIAWLKNVKISSWDPDTLAEEIRQVGEKFKKVEFEVVDISHRKAVMSLQAPWGSDEQNHQVYLRVEMRFPKLYPRNANAVLTLQRSGYIDEATHKLITTEMHTIAETYASRKRGCLEAVLRYLLRDQNLEQIVAWVLGESLLESRVLDPNNNIAADDSSSSDDDDQLNAGTREGPLGASANVLVPLAKGCGALWSETGKLVCFFPANGKDKEPVSLLSTLGVQNLEDTSESSRLFEGFGRLHAPGSPARNKARSGTTKTANDDDDSDGSETSDSSWKSSSSSSSSFETEQHVRGAAAGISSYRAGAFSGLHVGHRSRSPNRSNNSTTGGGGGNKLHETNRKSAVSINTFEDLIPSKRELAVDYQISGRGRDVCRHNAQVARSASLDELASVWMLVGLILDDAVPLEVIHAATNSGSSDDISIIARASLMDGQANMEFISSLASSGKALGRTRWGNHPLGPTYLLPAVFDHFERLGDVQMLAMLSCVFSSVYTHGSIPGDTLVSTEPTKSTMLPKIRSDYFPSKAVARSFFLQQREVDPDGFVLVDTIDIQPKVVSRRLLRGNNSAVGLNSHPQQQQRPHYLETRHESQLSSRAASFIADDSSDPGPPPYSTNVSVSTSPEGNRPSGHGHRATSSVAYSSARASLSALTQSYSNSPPNQPSGFASSLKKYSPSGSLTPGWVSSGIFSVSGGGGGGRPSRTSFHSGEAASQDSGRDSHLRSSFSLQNPRRVSTLQPSASRRSVRSLAASDVSEQTQQNKPTKRKKRVKTRLFNQDKFDLDGYATSPILDPRTEAKCAMYRASYAALLDVWQLHTQRAEMLKFDGLSDHRSDTAHASHKSDQTSLERPQPRLANGSTSRTTSPGLAIRRCCRGCGGVLAPIEKNGVPIGWHCVSPTCNGAKVPKRSACAVCDTSIHGLAVPCLQCGHMTCYECAQGWFGRPPSTKSGSRRPSAEDKIQHLSPIEDEEAVDDQDGDDAEHKQQQRQRQQLDDGPGEVDMDTSTSMCPTGCGCPCALLAVVTAPHPPSTASHPAPPSFLRAPTAPNMTRRASGGGNTITLPRSSSLLVPPTEAANTADNPLAALLALTQTHHRSKSVTLARSKASSISMAPAGNHTHADPNGNGNAEDFGDDADDDDNDGAHPWSGTKIATLGRGIGAGLSRGLSSKASDATIRRAK